MSKNKILIADILFRIKDYDSTIDITDYDIDEDFIQVLEDIRLAQQREDDDTLPDILMQIENNEF